MFFASAILLGVGFIFVEAMVLHYYAKDDAGKEIFEACKTILPPIITLILGYYFGTTIGRSGEESDTNEVGEGDATS